MTDLQTVRNAYLFLYGSDEGSRDLGRDYEEACRDFDNWLDLHTMTQIRRYLTAKSSEASKDISRLLGE